MFGILSTLTFTEPPKLAIMAAKRETVVGLDVGTTKICALVGEADDRGDIRILGVGTQPSSHGLRKGEIVNVANTIEAIEKAVAQAEQICGFEVNSVFAGISGCHIESFNSRAVIPLAKPTIGVTEKDISRAIESAQAVAIPRDREILHVVPQEFALDEQRGLSNPEGMLGSRLEARVHIVTGQVAAVQNVVKCINQAGLEVEDIVLQQLAASLAVLRKEEQESGVVLIDIGGGTTDYVFFRDEVLHHTKVLGVGGEHVTNDISLGFKLLQSMAEDIKIKFGEATPATPEDGASISLPAPLGRSLSGISRPNLNRIIELRLEELFQLVRRDLEEKEFLQRIGSGLVLTGGTSLLKGIEKLTERVTGLPVRRGVPRGVSGLLEVIDSPVYAVAVGLVKFGFQRRVSAHRPRLTGGNVLENRLRRIKKWVNKYF